MRRRQLRRIFVLLAASAILLDGYAARAAEPSPTAAVVASSGRTIPLFIAYECAEVITLRTAPCTAMLKSSGAPQVVVRRPGQVRIHFSRAVRITGVHAEPDGSTSRSGAAVQLGVSLSGTHDAAVTLHRRTPLPAKVFIAFTWTGPEETGEGIATFVAHAPRSATGRR